MQKALFMLSETALFTFGVSADISRDLAILAELAHNRHTNFEALLSCSSWFLDMKGKGLPF